MGFFIQLPQQNTAARALDDRPPSSHSPGGWTWKTQAPCGRGPAGRSPPRPCVPPRRRQSVLTSPSSTSPNEPGPTLVTPFNLEDLPTAPAPNAITAEVGLRPTGVRTGVGDTVRSGPQQGENSEFRDRPLRDLGAAARPTGQMSSFAWRWGAGAPCTPLHPTWVCPRLGPVAQLHSESRPASATAGGSLSRRRVTSQGRDRPPAPPHTGAPGAGCHSFREGLTSVSVSSNAPGHPAGEA